MGFADCRHNQVLVVLFHVSAWKSHLSGPWVAVDGRALDEQDVEIVAVLFDDDCHCRLTSVLAGPIRCRIVRSDACLDLCQ